MNSLSEMYQVATALQAKQPGAQLAHTLETFGDNFVQGRDQQEAKNLSRQKLEIERAKALIDNAAKQAEIDAKVQQTVIQGNVAKSLGILPLTAAENDVARQSAFAGINGVTSKPKVNSEPGKLAAMFESADKAGFLYLPTVTDKGFSISPHQKPKPDRTGARTADQTTQMQIKADAMAKDMAFRETLEQLQASGQFDPRIHTKANIVPSQDVVEKYRPAAQSYVTGDTKSYQARLDAIRKGVASEVAAKKKTRVDAIDSELATVTKKDNDWIPFNSDNKRKEELRRKRVSIAGDNNDPLGLFGGNQ